MKKLLLGAATLVTSLGLTAGVAAAAQPSGGVIQDTGPNSRASIHTRIKNNTQIKNKNTLHVSNNTDQHASSGDARVSGNTFGGDATSGDARNKNITSVSAAIDNNSADTLGNTYANTRDAVDGGIISDTGPNSSARISTEIKNSTRVNNTNNITVHNDTDQHAYSGDATVTGNTHGGDATSGDASNFNSTSVTLKVNN